jgi:hypothetical protein
MNRTNSHAARGMIFIHSAPAALRPHIEWALGSALDAQVPLSWTEQHAESGAQRAEFSWVGRVGTGAALASSLARLARVRFEVTEEPSPGADGQRFMYTPALGSFAATVGIHGDILVSEDRLRHAAASGDLYHALDGLLGKPWDDELEYFRHASEDAPVRWLHQVV